MALFEKSKTVKSRDRNRLISNIQSLYEDAVGYQQLSEHSNENPDIVSLEQVMWSEQHEPEVQKHQEASQKIISQKITGEKITGEKIKGKRANIVDDDENFDRLLFRLMKDMREVSQQPEYSADAEGKTKSSRNPSEPYLDVKEPQVELQPQRQTQATFEHKQAQKPMQLELSPHMRESLAEVVYQQIEGKIRAWIDGNLEQIVEDALRYEPSSSRDSNKDYGSKS